jgi:GNAT superfamily N-acetyltransferase
MRAPPARPVEPAREETSVQRLIRPTLQQYRALYTEVGQDYQWVDRLLLADDQLRRILEDDRVEVYLLTVEGHAAGFAELDRRVGRDVELAYFGLLPAFIGQGLGQYFLAWILRQAWSHGPDRVWVHTCDLDHPAALPTYRRAGFREYDRKIIQQPIPDDGC